jgi:N-acetyl-gamma-glutamyl-phosphate reductase
MEQALGDVAGRPVEVLFAPHLVPMDRGIFSTIYATPTKPVMEKDLTDLYRAYYTNAPFVRVRETMPWTKDTAHTNFLDVCVKVARGKIVVLACEDNLVRGASGVAVQNFNHMFGYEETAGLL